MTIAKTFEEAALAVDEMFNVAFQDAGCEWFSSSSRTHADHTSVTIGDDSGDEEDEEGDERREQQEEEDGDGLGDSVVDDRAPSPEAVLLKSSSTLENLGPTEDDEADFEKELAKMVTDNTESRKVDKKTALALWDQTVPPPVLRKKRGEDAEEAQSNSGAAEQGPGVMKFTLFTKRGNKPQVCHVSFVRSLIF